MSDFAFMPQAASEQAASTDRIFLLLVGFSLVTTVIVLSLVVVFSIRYRRGSTASRGNLPSIMTREFEIGWTSATLFLALFIFWWTASSQVSSIAAPPGALEVHVVAKQWMWKTQHANGAREIDELHVPIGTAVKLIMISEDVIHSFFVPAFRMKQDVLPNRYTETWFKGTKLGVFPILCTEYCGTQHSGMTGRVVVMPEQDYAKWLASQPQGDDLAREGAALFRAQGCSGCHAPNAKVRAPDLRGIVGRTIALTDGRKIAVDDAYLHDSLVRPKRDVVAGYDSIMPSYAGVLTESEIGSLIAYIRSPSFAAGEQP